jgi:ABC-type antimicrobial peptide transport system permease subunit
MLLTRAMQSLVFGVGVTDPLTLAGTALVVLLTAGAASFVPARQAARLDPIMVLREE